jgi:hypothetical protein
MNTPEKPNTPDTHRPTQQHVQGLDPVPLCHNETCFQDSTPEKSLRSSASILKLTRLRGKFWGIHRTENELDRQFAIQASNGDARQQPTRSRLEHENQHRLQKVATASYKRHLKEKKAEANKSMGGIAWG